MSTDREAKAHELVPGLVQRDLEITATRRHVPGGPLLGVVRAGGHAHVDGHLSARARHRERHGIARRQLAVGGGQPQDVAPHGGERHGRILGVRVVDLGLGGDRHPGSRWCS